MAREGARRMIAEAMEVETKEYVSRRRHERDKNEHAQVVRNGRAQKRKLTLGAGAISIQALRVDDRRPGKQFSSRILP